MYAWNSISKRGFRSSAVPRAIANEINQRNSNNNGDSDLDRQRRVNSPQPTSVMSAVGASTSVSSQAPKGCYCQMGSIFRAILSLIFILGVSAGVFYWIYMTQFSEEVVVLVEEPTILEVEVETEAIPDINGARIGGRPPLTPSQNSIEDQPQHVTKDVINELLNNRSDLFETVRRSKAILDMEINFSQEEGTAPNNETEETDDNDEPLEVKALKDKDVRLYIDFEGKLHRIKDLKENENVTVITSSPEKITSTTTTTTTATTTKEAEGLTTEAASQQPPVTSTPEAATEKNELEALLEQVGFMPTPFQKQEEIRDVVQNSSEENDNKGRRWKTNCL